MTDWFSHVLQAVLSNTDKVVLWVAGPGFAVWYAFHTTRVTIPNLIASFTQQIDEQRLAQQEIARGFADELNRQREENYSLMSEMRTHHREDLKVFWRELKDENRARHEDTLRMERAIAALTGKLDSLKGNP